MSRTKKLKIGDRIIFLSGKETGTIVKKDTSLAGAFLIRLDKGYTFGWGSICLKDNRVGKSKSKFWYISKEDIRKLK